jgi:hypothetical protein
MFVDPKYKKELYDYWEKTPPEFLYDEQNGSLFTEWIKDYVRLRRDNYDTPLFIRKDRVKQIEEWQKNEIKRMNFTLPKIDN